MKKKIAVFSTGWGCEIISQFLTGMQNALSKKSVDLFVFLCYPTYIDSAANKHGEMNIFSLPDLNDFDGTVIFGSGLNFPGEINNIIERSNVAGIPVIMQGANHKEALYVGSDNYLATLKMCEHLHNKHNVNNIIFFAGTPDSNDSEIRLRAVQEYLDKIGKPEALKDIHYTNWENASVTRYINKFCKEGRELPDAFICANDGLAMETCVSLDNHGISVPKDVLVTGYDFIDDSQIFDPSIASVDQCFTEMGEAAGKLWIRATEGENADFDIGENATYEEGVPGESKPSLIIPCKFVPGDSCNCYEFRNSDKIRRRVGRENFSRRATTTYFNRKLNLIDSTVLSCYSYQEFMISLHNLLVENHDYEGDSFHLLLEPNFGLSIYDQNIKLRRSGYSKYMEVLYSTEDGKSYEDTQFASKDLVPGMDPNGSNHMYVFLPLHEADESYGYLVFRDCMESVENHFLQTYQSRMGLVFDKFRHALSLDLINKRLLEVMRRDPLTNVNNRMAYDDKEKYLQSEINMNTCSEFAIAMFDVNNLKLINDSKGHDAGDEYLIRACHLICNVFKHSPVYRIGGDEFVAILTGEDYESRDALLEELRASMTPYSNVHPLPADYISIASGMACYTPPHDMSIQDIVKRADEAMYKNKAEIKSQK